MYITEIAVVNAVNLGSTLLAAGDGYRAVAGLAVYSVRLAECLCGSLPAHAVSLLHPASYMALCKAVATEEYHVCVSEKVLMKAL